MRKKGEMTRSYARGMVALIFFVLAVQVAIFTIKSYESRHPVTQIIKEESIQAETSVNAGRVNERSPNRLSSKKNGDKKRVIIKPDKAEPGKEDQELSEDNGEESSKADAYVPIDIRAITSSSKLELNSADSTDLVSLPGIGPFFASKILEYRERLGGFAYKEQLMEVYGIDKERFSVFGERIWADTTLISRIKVSVATQEELSANPYIGAYAARAIIKFRDIEGANAVTLAALAANRIIKVELVKILKYYLE
jgi:DNA uptake protein ComE-like DNA-binding protein